MQKPLFYKASNIGAKELIFSLEIIVFSLLKGALTLIDFESRVKGQSEPSSEALKWKALAHIRLMQYQEAMKIYETLVEKPDCDPSVYCYLAACYFFLGLYRKAEEAVQRAPHSSLQNRVQVPVLFLTPYSDLFLKFGFNINPCEVPFSSKTT